MNDLAAQVAALGPTSNACQQLAAVQQRQADLLCRLRWLAYRQPLPSPRPSSPTAEAVVDVRRHRAEPTPAAAENTLAPAARAGRCLSWFSSDHHSANRSRRC